MKMFGVCYGLLLRDLGFVWVGAEWLGECQPADRAARPQGDKEGEVDADVPQARQQGHPG